MTLKDLAVVVVVLGLAAGACKGTTEDPSPGFGGSGGGAGHAGAGGSGGGGGAGGSGGTGGAGGAEGGSGGAGGSGGEVGDSRELRVELTWNAEDDVDLHLLHANADVLDPASWFDGLYDSNVKNNPAPSWDEDGPDDDPAFSADDKLQGAETVVVPVASTEHVYEIAGHWAFSTHDNAEVELTATIYCGGKLVRTITRDLQREHQAADIGTVTMRENGECSVTPRNFRMTVDLP